MLTLSNKHVVDPLFRPCPDVTLFVGVLLFIWLVLCVAGLLNAPVFREV